MEEINSMVNEGISVNKYKRGRVFASWILLQLSILVVEIYILFENSSENLLVLLPLTFMFLILVFYRVYLKAFTSILYFFYVFSSYVRFVITPFLMVLANYHTDYYIRQEIYNNLDKAVLLMVYEIICVFLILYYYSKKEEGINIEKCEIEKPLHATNFIMLMLFLTFLGILFCFPELLILLHSNVGTPEEDWAIRDIINNLHNSLNPIIYWGFKLIVEILQITFPIYVYNWAYLKLSSFKAAFVGILMIALSLFIMTDSRAISAFTAVSLLLVMAKNQGNHIKKIIPFIISGIGIVILLALFKDQGFTGQRLPHILTAVQGYFGGVVFTAGFFSISEELSLSEILKNFITPLPFFGMFVKDYVSSNQLVNQAIFHSSIYGVIFPMIGEGARFFTIAFAPIFSVITISMGLKFENMAKIKVNKDHKVNLLNLYYIYFILLIMGVAINMYDFSILIGFLAYFVICGFIFNVPGLKNICIKL